MLLMTNINTYTTMSNTRLISTKELIPRIYDEYKMEHSDWEMKAPQYFMYALQDMQMNCIVEDSRCLEFTDYKLELPIDIKAIIAIEHNGRRLDLNSNIRMHSSSIGCSITANDTTPCSGHTFTEGSATLTTPCYVASEEVNSFGSNGLAEYHINNNWITFEARSGYATIYFRKPAVEYDCKQEVYYPMIQDIEAIKQALMTYVVMNIIRRGYKHRTLNLTDNNPFTNIGMMWKEHRKSAKSKFNPLTPDDRTEMNKVLTTLITSPKDNTSILFNN